MGMFASRAPGVLLLLLGLLAIAEMMPQGAAAASVPSNSLSSASDDVNMDNMADESLLPHSSSSTSHRALLKKRSPPQPPRGKLNASAGCTDNINGGPIVNSDGQPCSSCCNTWKAGGKCDGKSTVLGGKLVSTICCFTCGGNIVPAPKTSPSPPPVRSPPVQSPSPINNVPPSSGSNHIVGYFESYKDKASTAVSLAKMPAYVTVVALAFAKPTMTYTRGSNTFANTGLEFSSTSFSALKSSVAQLRARGVKVILALGGQGYPVWAGLNPGAVRALVDDLGLNGLDIDYEPLAAVAGCTGTGTALKCKSDTEFKNIIAALRAEMPANRYFMSLAAFSVAAYGTGEYISALPGSSSYTGMMIAAAATPAAQSLDLINIMSYDAGLSYKPLVALAAFRKLFPKQLLALGVQVPPEAWGGHVITMAEAQTLVNGVVAQRGNGMMIWTLNKPGTPSATQLLQLFCTKLGLNQCTTPLPF